MIEKPLTRSGVSERIWALYNTDKDAFYKEIRAYFALGYPGFTPVKINYERRIVFLRDDR